MRVYAGFLLFAVLLGCLPFFGGCAIHTPTAEELLSVFTQPFVCGFSASDSSGEAVPCVRTRTDAGATLCISGTSGNTVFVFSGDAVSLSVGAAAGSDALLLPVTLPCDRGAVQFRSAFCVTADDGFTVSKEDVGYVVSSADGAFTAVFTGDGVPVSLSLNTSDTSLVLTIHSFLP